MATDKRGDDESPELAVEKTLELTVPREQISSGAGGPGRTPGTPSRPAPEQGRSFAAAAGNTGGAKTGGGSSIVMEGAASQLETRIPEGLTSKRPSPALDPVARGHISRAAKWLMLIGVLFVICWLPSVLGKISKGGFDLALILTATVVSAAIATGVPRLILPGVFGRWHEAVEAMRDWIIVGIMTGIVYWILVAGARMMHLDADNPTRWLMYRLPLLLVAGVVGLLTARGLAIRGDAVVGDSTGAAIWQTALQVVLLAVLERPIELALKPILGAPGVSTAFGLGAILCTAVALGIVTWATSADANLSTIRRRRGASGFYDGTGPINLTLTVIGGRESGKTVLLAAAFYEWSTQNIGNLRITPALDAVGPDGTKATVASLEDVARELYVNNQFPVGTVSTQNLPFDLSIGSEKIARFTFLDYPGGAIAGRGADSRIVQEFWERVEDTDGILLIADMSYVRRAKKDDDWLEVRRAYRTVMQRLVDRNGKRRVVPVALVLTKCDEFVDPETGHVDMKELRAGLKEFQYDDLEAEWRRLCGEHGPGFAEFSTWITSAITYSQPQLGPNGRPDYSRPFMIAPPPPSITPTGCASPLLWMCSKVMRWNMTLFYDISTFWLGSTPRIRRRIDSVLEMEQVANQRAGKA